MPLTDITLTLTGKKYSKISVVIFFRNFNFLTGMFFFYAAPCRCGT